MIVNEEMINYCKNFISLMNNLNLDEESEEGIILINLKNLCERYLNYRNVTIDDPVETEYTDDDCRGDEIWVW